MSSIKEVDANYNILSIQVSLDGFSFLVKNELSQETVFIHNIGLPQQASPQIALVKLEQCFKDVVELQLHGSPMVLHYVLDACCRRGARLARPGEFSERAYLNDKMDLAQAEAVLDLITSGSQAAARAAARRPATPARMAGGPTHTSR